MIKFKSNIPIEVLSLWIEILNDEKGLWVDRAYTQLFPYFGFKNSDGIVPVLKSKLKQN